MFRKHLSLQLGLAFLLATLLPLLGVGLLTLHLLERSTLEQVRANQEQIARVAAALVRDRLDTAVTRLKSIALLIKKDEDPRDVDRRLKAYTEAPDVFLEIGYWDLARTPVVVAQSQQAPYFAANSLPQDDNNRNYEPKLGQFVYDFRGNERLFGEPLRGNTFIGSSLQKVGSFTGLPVSVPAPDKRALVGTLDFKLVSQTLAGAVGNENRLILLLDGNSRLLAGSGDPDAMRDYVQHGTPAGHAGWQVLVREPRDLALAPLRPARRQALLWLSGAALLAVGLAALFGTRLLRPVRALAATADRLGRGDLAARSGVARQDEIGQLAQAFDRMAAALQELDRLKGEFVAHVSHELRTPLTSAKIALANVEEGLAGKESLARVREDLDRLIRMVNELLDAARLEAGLELTREPTDLGALVRSSVDTLRPLARVPLDVSGAGDTLPLDRARVRQIVVNLVDNALKYAKGRVDVAVSGREVRITDDGPGVPPELRERIFDRFARIEAGPKPAGVGLGLSIARKLARLHGGSLACEGNTFVLRL